jgi:hypothetical protein
MKPSDSIRPRLLLALSTALVACDGPCLNLPCAPTFAIALTVKNGEGQFVTGASVQFTGPQQGTQPCAGSCYLDGGAGTYQLTVSAAGFQTVARSVTVVGALAKRCSCPSVTTQTVNITMVAAAQ